MTPEQLQALNRIIRTAWKELANNTDDDYDTTFKTTTDVLEQLERMVEVPATVPAST